MSSKLRRAAVKSIRVGQEFGCIIPDLPQVMTVTSVNEDEVHFTRKGVSGIKMMDTLKFCEIAVPREADAELDTCPYCLSSIEDCVWKGKHEN